MLIPVHDFVAAQLPAMCAAMKAGTTVVPYIARVPGSFGHDHVASVTQDSHGAGLIDANAEKGNVVVMSGAAGATTSQNFLNERLKTTNWNPADTQRWPQV